MSKNRERLKIIVTVAVMTALEIVLHRLLSVKTPTLNFHFGFLPVAAVAILYGPVWAGITSALSELIGSLIFPVGAYFPGFTLTALLIGVIFGAFLYRTRYRLWKVFLSCILVNVVCSLGLNTLWLYLLSGKGFWAMMPPRLIKAAVMVPLQIATIPLLHRLLEKINRIAPAGTEPAGAKNPPA